MLSKRFTVRLTDDDRRVLSRLHRLTGCNYTAIIRLALRDMLETREARAAQSPLERTGT